VDQRTVRRGRIAVASCFGVHGAVSGSFATRIPWVQEHLHAGPGELGLALLAPAVGAMIAMPMAGRLVHRFGSRGVTRCMIALWAAMLAVPVLAPNLPLLCLSLAVYGAVAGTCDVAMNAQGVVIEQRIGRSIMSGLHGMWSVGGLVGGAVGVLAAHARLDARIHLGAMAVVLIGVGAIASRRLPDIRADEGVAAPPRFVLPPRSVLLIGLVGFCAVFGESASQDWCAVYLKDLTGASPGVAAISYTAFAFTMAAGRLCGDLVVRRLGPVRTVRSSGGLAALGGVLVVFARTPVPAITGFMLIGAGVAVVVPLAFAAAGNATVTPSEGVSGVASISYTSGFIAPSAIGGIAAATNLSVSFGLVTVLSAAMVLGAGALAGRRAVPRPQAAPAG
jgi:MFS family permease